MQLFLNYDTLKVNFVIIIERTVCDPIDIVPLIPFMYVLITDDFLESDIFISLRLYSHKKTELNDVNEILEFSNNNLDCG